MSVYDDETKFKKAEHDFINEALANVYDNILRIEEKELKKSSFSDITVKEVHLVHAISLHEPKSASQIAKKMHLSRGTLTVNLRNLERKGLIHRTKNSQDQRVTDITLTKRGRVLYRAHNAFHSKMVDRFLAGFNLDELKVVKHALVNLQDFLDELT
ncbi:MarR family winged helix-turn-helix transcriptional regulator [Holzapfeliella floricola]|uniref:Transcriptional regulator n=1 Tax=Holzapfeliella floricola DSM 23037 = JCM 16512 TaxID=1423744 RepID=A0A0R2DUY6_9LACO|nr:MarR family transcriptional regulator [Holzapfeliella floricola]KRN04029.1 transcriptional regulator [Holzapfeliella floricola DSM 23037 = JCM 16512]